MIENEHRPKESSENVGLVDGKMKRKICSLAAARLLLKSITLELIMFFFILAYFGSIATSQNLILGKVCLVYFNLSTHICSNLSNHTVVKEDVETVADNYILLVNLIRMAPASLLSIFVGPWSDKYGRKLPLKVALVGVILDTVGLIVNTVYLHAPADYLLISSLCWGLSGGFTCVLTVLYSCASDVSSERSRIFQYARLEFVFGSGVALGTVFGGLLFNYYGYLAVFGMCSAGYCVCLLLGWFVLEETRLPKKEVSCRVMVSAFFTTENIKESYQSLKKRRPNQGRAVILLLMGSISAIIITYAATQNIAYMFTYHMYNWDVATYSTVTAITTAANEATMLIAVPLLTNVMNLGECALGLLGTVSLIASNLVKAFAIRGTIYYIACGCGIFSAVAPMAVRTHLSKVVDKDECGKIFAFLSACESLFPMLATALFTLIFNATLKTLPGLAYIIAAVLLLLPLFVFCWRARVKPPTPEDLSDLFPSEESSIQK